MADDKIRATLVKIKEIADGLGPSIEDARVKGQVERIAGLADSALNEGGETHQTEGGRP